jgi:hypothetical protein
MPSNITRIPAPRVPLIDERTGLVSREWFRFFNNLFVLTGSGTNQFTLNDFEIQPDALAQTESALGDIQSQIQALQLLPPPQQIVPADYGSFYDTTTQVAAAINTPYPVTFNTTVVAKGVRRGTPTSRIYANRPGVYNFAFSIQFDKTSGGTALAYVWARLNGVNVSNTASQIRIQGNNGEIFCAANLFFEMSNGDYFELMWAADDTSVQLLAEAATAVHPGIPSVILTVNQVNI